MHLLMFPSLFPYRLWSRRVRYGLADAQQRAAELNAETNEGDRGRGGDCEEVLRGACLL